MKILKKGSAVPAVLIISSSFVIVIYGILILLATQLDFSNRDLASDKSLNVAEAGIEYYKWQLNQDPTNYTDNLGEHVFYDAEGNEVGTYRIEVTPPSDSSSRVTVKSTGWAKNNPGITRTVEAVFGQRPLTAFAFLHNSNIWFGNEIVINGPILTNGGIRMDGTNNSTVQTTVETYTCGVETGCSSPTQKPGIWGNGGPQELWQFPVPAVDFDSINVDFAEMKMDAQTTGLYVGPSGKSGYHITFNSDGTFTLKQVVNAQTEKGYSFEFGCENVLQDIKVEQTVGTYDVSSAPVIFIEDDVWVDGTLNGETTIVAARFPIDTNNADIIIMNNVVYLDNSGNNRLGLVSQKDIVIGEEIPETLEINGGLLAQKGRVIRHHYNYSQCSKGGGTDSVKDELIISGSIISNLSSYWNFSGGPGVPASGFVKTTISYDPFLEQDPPSYFPNYGGFQLISWKEVKN